MFETKVTKYTTELNGGPINLSENLIPQLFNVSLDILIENKYYVMKHIGLSMEQVNNLSYYEFENYIDEIKKNK